jgi:hypothetical protein
VPSETAPEVLNMSDDNSNRKTLTYAFYKKAAQKFENATTVSEQLDVLAWALEEKRAWGSEWMALASDRILATLKADLGAI